MSSSYVVTTYINNAGRGLLSIYLMLQMGSTETGRVAAQMAPYIFVSLLATSFSAECFIRGSRHRFTGYRDRVASLLIDTLYLLGSFAYILVQHSTFLDTLSGFMLASILISSAFGQISFNHLLNRKAWPHLALASIFEVALHAALLVTWFRNDPANQFILLCFSRWLFLNIFNAEYIFCKNRVAVRRAKIRTINYLTHIHWIIPAIHVTHLVNLSFKTLWTTMDTYIINMYWTGILAGNYRFIKSLGALPAMAFGPMWTIHRNDISACYKQSESEGRLLFFKIVRLSMRYSALLLPALLILWFLHAQLKQSSEPFFDLTWDAIAAFSIWWLISSCFGWVRYFMVSHNHFSIGNLQSIFIVLAMLLTIPFHEYINPVVFFPGIILASNLLFLHYIRRLHA